MVSFGYTVEFQFQKMTDKIINTICQIRTGNYKHNNGGKI
jgi:hypothetical protein